MPLHLPRPMRTLSSPTQSTLSWKTHRLLCKVDMTALCAPLLSVRAFTLLRKSYWFLWSMSYRGSCERCMEWASVTLPGGGSDLQRVGFMTSFHAPSTHRGIYAWDFSGVTARVTHEMPSDPHVLEGQSPWSGRDVGLAVAPGQEGFQQVARLTRVEAHRSEGLPPNPCPAPSMAGHTQWKQTFTTNRDLSAPNPPCAGLSQENRVSEI